MLDGVRVAGTSTGQQHQYMAGLSVWRTRGIRGWAMDLSGAARYARAWALAAAQAGGYLPASLGETELLRDQARYALASAMPAALERGEFVVEYQPMVWLADGRLSGV